MTRSALPRRLASTSRSRGDAVEQPAPALERVRPADGLLAADQHVVGGLEEQQRRCAAPVAPSSARFAASCSKKTPERTSTTTAIGCVDALLSSTSRTTRAAASAAGCRPRSSRGPPAPWRRCCARAGHAGDDDELRPRRPPLCRVRISAPRYSPVAVLTETVLPLRSATASLIAGGGRAGRCPGTCGDLLDGGGPELAQRAEVLDQRLAAHLAEPGHVVEQALDHRLGAPGAVVGDREAVRLVADPLEEVEALAGARQDHRVLLAGQPDLLEPLGETARRGCRRCRARRGRAARPRPAAARRRRPPARARRRTCGGGRSRGRPASARARRRRSRRGRRRSSPARRAAAGTGG